MTRLTLYTTLGCHLCEQLEAELIRLGHADIELERVEIASHDALVERYGTRIPVLRDTQGDELERGFDAERLAAWLASRGLLAHRAVETRQDRASSAPEAKLRGGRRFLR